MKKNTRQDACVKCLNTGKVSIGDNRGVVKTSGNYKQYKYRCPRCCHIWSCMFYEGNDKELLSAT